ncbi:hypothetical protein ACJMK2_007336 [Sinanodonta woodiana]|uniref:Uncharacterized protein n=1 Tax=Sinanodonta woodiana TaxID=1069815 RepID=A0ABD3VIA2_SINWO
MLVILRTIFGILLLTQQSSSVALPETFRPPSSLPDLSDIWDYPYVKNIQCQFPYIWQKSVGRCCYPVFNCGPGYGIEFCHEDKGNDSCVECKNSSKQYHLVHSFDGETATCFKVSKQDEDECIVEETLPARWGNSIAACGLPCECNPGNCFYGDDPCRCQQRQDKCKSNQQMNRVTGACEECPWYSFNDKEGCGTCLVNKDVWMSGSRSSMVTVPPSTQNATVLVTTTVYLPDSTSEKIDTTITTALFPDTNNAPIQLGLIIGFCVVAFICATVAVIAVYLIKRRISNARSGASSSQYSSISQVPPSADPNQEPSTEYQEESETSDLINKSESTTPQPNGLIRGQSVSNNNNHLVNHEVEDHMDSPKSSESDNHLGIHGRINERNQSASSNSASPENLSESGEGTHQIKENTGIRNRQENPAEQMEMSDGINDIEPSNDLAIAERQQDMNCSGRQAIVDLQTGSNVVQIPHHKTDNQDKGILYKNQNIVHAETTDAPSSILFSSDSNNPCSSSHLMEKNLDGKIKLQLRKDIEDPNYFLGMNPFMRGSPVENSHCWSFPRDSVADNDSITVAQTQSGHVNDAPNSYPQAVCAGDVDRRTNDNTTIILVKECNSSETRSLDLKTPNLEGGTCCEDSKNPNEESRIPSEDDHPQNAQCLTMPISPTSPSNSSLLGPFLNRSILSASEVEADAHVTGTQAVCTGDEDKTTHDNSSKAPVKEVVRVHPLNTRSLHLGAPNQESGTCSEDSRIPNEEPQIHSEEGHPLSPQCLNMPLSPTSASNSSLFRPFLNRSMSSTADRPTAKVTPMRQKTPSQRQDEGTLEDNNSMVSDSNTDISMAYGVVHFAGGLSDREESIESSNPSLSSYCEDSPPSFSHVTDPPSTATRAQMEDTGFRRTGGLRSATRNGSQIPMMGNQSRGGPDGASVPSYHIPNRVREPRQVFETEVKEPEQSEETDPKTLLSSTQERDRAELERQDSDFEDHSEKIGLKVNQTEDLEKLRDICEGLVFPASLCDAAENSSDEVQGKALRKDFKAMEANASDKESQQRNVPLHNDDQVQYNSCSFSSELEDEENNLNITTRSKCNTEETCHSYSSLQDKEDIQIETKGVEDSEKDGIDKSSLEEIVKEANDSFNDTDPDVEESSSDQRSSHSEDEGVCSNGDAELNREQQQPSRGQIELQNEFNLSSLSVNSDESGIGIEEQTIQNVQDS